VAEAEGDGATGLGTTRPEADLEVGDRCSHYRTHASEVGERLGDDLFPVLRVVRRIVLLLLLTYRLSVVVVVAASRGFHRLLVGLVVGELASLLLFFVLFGVLALVLKTMSPLHWIGGVKLTAS
jgi:hypothetical protein